MIEDAAMLVATLRPGEHEATFADALRRHRIADLRDGSRASAYRQDQSWRIELDRLGRMATIIFWAGFPRDVAIGDLRIGMSADEVAACVPRAETLAIDSASDGVYLHLPGVKAGIRRAYVRQGTLRVLEIADEGATETPLLTMLDERMARLRARARPATTDPDVLLAHWVEDARMLTFDRAVVPLFAVWLYGASPDERHQVAQQWNWDNGTVPLNWIVHQQDCDLATAVMVHQMAEPDYYRPFAGDRSRVPEHALNGFDLIVAIRSRIADGAYHRREIAIEQSIRDIGSGDGVEVAARSGRRPASLRTKEGFPVMLFERSESE